MSAGIRNRRDRKKGLLDDLTIAGNSQPVRARAQKQSSGKPVQLLSPAVLGEMIRDARKDACLSQQELADMAGVGRRFVSELENGKSTLEFGRVLIVCAASGVDVLARRR